VGLENTFATLSTYELAWCLVIVELPHHKGGLGITTLPASGMAAFYSLTAHLISWLGSLPHASEWIAGQNLADPNTWNSSALQTLKQLYDNLLTHYNCTEWAPPLADDAPASGVSAQGHDDDSARHLSLPPLNLLASLRVRQDEDNGEVAARPSLPAQRQVTKHIMQTWMLHEQMHRNPPTDRMRDVHMLHHTQSVTMLDETSALHGNMPQHNDEEGGKQPRLSFLPCSVSVGTDGPCMDDRRPKCAAHHGVNHREGLSCLLPSIFRKKIRVAKVPGTTLNINSGLHHASNWNLRNNVLRALDLIWNDVGFATTHKLRCSRVKATATQISKSATSMCRSRPICWWTSQSVTISKAPVTEALAQCSRDH
jgi:hypothetical protein